MRMPVVFVGHGSPMIAIEDNDTTRKFKEVGDYIIKKHEKPRAILSISAHWYTNGNLTQRKDPPKQIYDMYGFPKELYDVKYNVNSSDELTDEIKNILGDEVHINDEWGIDHGTWTVLCHMFPDADIPVVQLSVNASLDAEGIFKIGERLKVLRDKNYLIIGSGNVVHNLARVEWNNDGGTDATESFDKFIKESILNKDYNKVINYKENENSKYAVPRPDHFYPLVYVLGASDGNDATVFNEYYTMGSLSMTSYLFED